MTHLALVSSNFFLFFLSVFVSLILKSEVVSLKFLVVGLFGICLLKRVYFHVEKFEHVFYLQGVPKVEFQGLAKITCRNLPILRICVKKGHVFQVPR